MRLRVCDRPVQRLQINRDPVRFHIHPATLAAQVAGIENREIKERRKILTALSSRLEPLNRADPFVPEVPHELAEAAPVCGAKNAQGELRKHFPERAYLQRRCQRRTVTFFLLCAAYLPVSSAHDEPHCIA